MQRLAGKAGHRQIRKRKDILRSYDENIREHREPARVSPINEPKHSGLVNGYSHSGDLVVQHRTDRQVLIALDQEFFKRQESTPSQNLPPTNGLNRSYEESVINRKHAIQQYFYRTTTEARNRQGKSGHPLS